MTQELPLISTPDAILRIKKIIENKQGDPGRLQYISERLQSGKKLFHSDHIYLTNKISAEVIPIEIKEPNENDKKIKDVKRLIALKLGEPGRLAYILKTLEKNKDLYHSDEIYLKNKIEQFHEYTEGKRIKRRVRRAPEPEHLEEIKETVEIFPKEKPHSEPFEDIPEKLQGIEDAVLSEKPKKTSDLFDLIDDTHEVDLEIQQEREKISKLKANHEQIKIQHDELSQLIAYRQEYEQKINHEKEILEKEIKFEQEKVKEKDDLVAQLIKNQSKLLQSKTEREVLLEQIKIDKEKSEKQLAEMHRELDELKEEYEILQKEIKSKKENLEKQIRDQKEKNNKLKEESEEE
ncbi:MAG: hypothetical protein PVG23_07470 [Nitrosopumilaceae archaeon]